MSSSLALLVGIALKFGNVSVTLNAAVDPDCINIWVLAEQLLDVAWDVIQLCIVYYIAFNTWQLLLNLLNLVTTSAGDDHFFAESVEALCEGLADAACGTENEDSFIGAAMAKCSVGSVLL